MEETEDEFHDAFDEFPFYECKEYFIDRVESSGGASISASSSEVKIRSPATLRRRRSFSRRKSSDGSTIEVSLDNYLNSREIDKRHSRKHKEYEKKSSVEDLVSVELDRGRKDSVIVEKKEKIGESSVVTDASDGRKNEDSVRAEVDLRENNRDEDGSGVLIALTGLIIKAIVFLIVYLFKIVMLPMWLGYYAFMLVFNPLGLLMGGRGFYFMIAKKVWSLVCKNVSPFVYEWFKEHKAIWKLGLKCSWGLLWSAYVGTVLVGLLVSAFVMGGIVIRGVEEPIKMTKGLNFDYTEKSPVANVPITTYPELSHDIYLGEKLGFVKASGLRVIPPNHKLQATVLLTLPESDYNRNLGIFQVKVHFLANDGKILASSRRPCMLHFRSPPIRLLLTFLKMAPILTGYTSETQNLKISFKGFTEGVVPTACLRVVIEQRAEFHQGAGIPEIYAASLTLESELPLLKKLIWSWKKTLFVWISMTIFTMELFFALLCCRPLLFPKIRLGGATNGGASQNDCPGQR